MADRIFLSVFLSMKLYIISGLGADRKVFEKIEFPSHLEVIFIDWLIPKRDEDFQDYVSRMAEKINVEEPFYLLGYSLGGMVVQEIHKKIPAEKVVIMASIKSEKGKSKLMKFGQWAKIYKFLPISVFNEKSYEFYALMRYFFDPKNPKILKYFQVREPYYLKWCIEKALQWEGEDLPNVVQILGDKDIVFPINNSNPDYILKEATHLFPITKAKEVSDILQKEFC